VSAAALAMVLSTGVLSLPAVAVIGPVEVPGTADLWLAGMPDGSTASINDSAPAQSPVLVTIGPQVVGFSFDAVGSTHHGPGILRDAEGLPDPFILSHAPGAENGISDVTAPVSALMGVFLDDDQPDGTPAPVALSFATEAERDFLTLSPALKQVFFIGDGRNSALDLQLFEVPAGASRLFLGTMDGYEWNNNAGSLSVTLYPVITDPPVVPEGSTVISVLVLAGLGGWCCVRRRGTA